MFRRNRKRFIMPNAFGRQPTKQKQKSPHVRPILGRNSLPDLTMFGMPDASVDFSFTIYADGSGSGS